MKKLFIAVMAIGMIAIAVLIWISAAGIDASREVAQTNSVAVVSAPPVAVQTNALHFEGLHVNPDVK